MEYQDRVQLLQREVKRLSTASNIFRKKRSPSPGETLAQEMRKQRLKEILNELAPLANRKKP